MTAAGDEEHTPRPAPTGWHGHAVRHTRRIWRRHHKLMIGWVLVGLIGVVVASQLLPSQEEATYRSGSASYAVVVGVPGLRWSDVDKEQTPHLWQLAEDGAVGSLAVESASRPTCPIDGWLTLSAGAPAGGSGGLDEGACPGVAPGSVEQTAGTEGALAVNMDSLAAANREGHQASEVGTLGGAARCTSAIGAGAAYGAARPTGRVDNYLPDMPSDEAQLSSFLSNCTMSFVDAGDLPEDPEERAAAVSRADEMAGQVTAAAADDSMVMVAGLSDTSTAAHLHTVIVSGGGFDGGWLTSSNTGREGYLRLIDVAPTVVAALDSPLPKPFAGVPAGIVDSGDESSLAADAAQLADMDDEAAAQQDAILRLLLLLVIAQLVFFVASTPTLRRIRYGAATQSGRGPTIWTFRAMVSAATTLSLTLPAATLVDFVPWWRADHSMIALLASTVVIVSGLTALVLLAPKRRSPMGLMVTVSSVGMCVVAMDVFTGGRLQFSGLAAYSVISSAGNTGLGPLGFGVFATSLLMTVGCIAQMLARQWRPLLIAFAGCAGIFVIGSPYLGNDPAGAVSLTIGVCLASAISTGGWLTFARFAWAAFAGLGLLMVLAVADLARGEVNRGPLGGFVADLFGEVGGGQIRGVMESDVISIATNPLTLLLIGSVVFSSLVLLRPSGGLKRAFGLYPSVRAGFVGAIVATFSAGLMGGQGFIPVGAAAAITMPLLVVMAQRVLARAQVRDGRGNPTDLEVPSRGGGESVSDGVTVESRG